jgi:co-chaperonin GroES (HSP10)
MKNLKCVNDNILIELPSIEEKTAAGIIKTEEMLAAEQKDTNVVTILSVGDAVTKVKANDKIMIRNTSVPIFEYDGVRYGGIKEYDVFCIVK